MRATDALRLQGPPVARREVSRAHEVFSLSGDADFLVRCRGAQEKGRLRLDLTDAYVFLQAHGSILQAAVRGRLFRASEETEFSEHSRLSHRLVVPWGRPLRAATLLRKSSEHRAGASEELLTLSEARGGGGGGGRPRRGLRAGHLQELLCVGLART